MTAIDKSGARSAISRRAMLAGAAGAGLSSLLPGRSSAQAATKVTQFIWTGAQEPVPRRIAAEYVKAHPGVTIDIIAGTNGATYPKLAASRDIDPKAPLLNLGFFNLDASERGRLVDMWLPIDAATVPNVAHILPQFRQKGDLGAFFCMDAGGLVYNTKYFGQSVPDSWDALFDPALKGKIALFDGFWPGNGLVVLAKLHGGSEDNIEPAIALYEKAARAGQFHSMVTSNAQMQQLLVSGEVVLAPHFRGVALPWAKAGAPIGYAMPREGQVAFPEGFQLVNGTSETQLPVCRDLINISLSPENVLDYCLTADVIPLMDNVKLPDSVAADPTIQPKAIASAIQLDYAKIAANGPKWADMWNKRVKANM
ncbi:ABC transporter substrate-binding protein [Chelatococcus asaccharovorans]|uniref:ABC transporter substrate-binding protein n=1 Tax=Chelatococcus asaccharovorans TaxID=28210 RepID=UPI00224C757D|nr:extracellular solute-binding protein [Chelatococcus asaccharovorans]CAH1650392.1 putative spermidine/putrescine transport system substrate-binding protein [Chelatococcus asaccharovorans]CAH1692248.1 putative spermidine/putrescine transport system substrate-binding protein [Chelatococcus asaccharovorans]